eukprot:CAMPEP_0170606846 /NCGR_PEP_ID=MMETSP0224-20130122/20739_1 /TAXON_ID=285029 /ORGANISM="Togula jolla, Strain CCCM 725" /LENGTH=191 /DNA_ID=CAMNT_0010931973 /DNA_START=50 /DNA_END=625 /DNA_ORIENTATION=+
MRRPSVLVVAKAGGLFGAAMLAQQHLRLFMVPAAGGVRGTSWLASRNRLVFSESSTGASRGDSVKRFATAADAEAMTEIPGYKTTYQVLREGSGKEVSKGARVTVHATGVVEETGKKFWSTKDPGQEPFTYKAGLGMVITGWDQGCLGMRVGEERRLVIPAAEGYGARGFPAWGIPAGATLSFTLECLKVI